MGLFDALDGRRWKKKTNWGTTRPLNEWFGVVLNGWGDVVKVDLRGNGLTGQLPACLPLLAQVCPRLTVPSLLAVLSHSHIFHLLPPYL